MHIIAKTKSWGQRTCLQSSEPRLYLGTDLGKATNISSSMKVPKSTVASIILKWKKFGTTRTLPRAGRSAKPSHLWKRALSRLVTKHLMVTLVELHDNICRWEKPTKGQTSLQHFTNLGFMALWTNSILSSVKTHEKTLAICKTAPKGSADSKKQDYLVWWTSILSIMFERNQLCSSPAEYHPKSKVCWWQPHAVGVFFNGGDWSGLRESLMETCSTALRTSEWAEGSLSDMTMNLSTQPRQHMSG